ncbi:MAG: DUF4349 domain-containing protein [Polyangiaceae bacterium]
MTFPNSTRVFAGIALAALATWPVPAAAEKPQVAVAITPTLVETRAARLVVDDGVVAVKRVTEEVAALGGRLLSGTDAHISLLVPRARVETLYTRLEALGAFTRQSATTVDQSASLADARSAVTSARRAVERRERLARTLRGVTEELSSEQLLQEARDELRRAEDQVRSIEERAQMVELEIALEAPGRESIEPATLPFPWLDELGHERLANPPSTRSDGSLVLRGVEDYFFGWSSTYAPHPEPFDDVRFSGSLALSMRILGEANPVGVFGGMDLRLGASRGFVYDLQLLLGAGVPLGRRLAIGLSTGPGIDGVTSVVPFGVKIPLELWVSWDLARFMALHVYARDGWVLASEERKGGTRAPIGDELAAGIGFTLASREEPGTYTARRDGWRLGLGYRELMGTEVYLLELGWSAIHSDFSVGY